MPPVVIAAGIAGAAAIGGGVLAASGTKSAAKTAANTAAANSANNNALAREMYGKNSANLLPYSQSGMRAGNALNEMLLGPQPQGTMQYGQPQSANDPQWASYLQANPDVQAEWARNANDDGFASPEAFAQWHYQNYGQREGRPLGQSPQTAPTNTVPQPSAWDQFRNSTNYQFRLNEGLKAGNQGYAAGGMLESGAALKGLTQYGQNFAANELGNYQAMLANQQQLGMGAASALAGVGQNMVNNVTANNNSAASAQANAGLMGAQANSNTYGSIAGAIGNVAGAWGSSYQPTYQQSALNSYSGNSGNYYPAFAA